MVWVLEYGLSYRCQISVQDGNVFWQLLLWWCECCYRGPTHRGGKSGCKLVTEFDSYSDDGVSAVIGVQHREVPNLGASWWRNLTVTLMMVWVLVYGSYIHRGPKSGCKLVTEFDSYSYRVIFLTGTPLKMSLDWPPPNLLGLAPPLNFLSVWIIFTSSDT